MTRTAGVLAVCALLLVGCGPPPEGKLIWRNGEWVRGPAPVEGTPAGELALVQLHVEEGRNHSAVRAAKRFLKRYPADPRGEQVMERAVQAYLNRGRYMLAYEWCEKLLAAHPAGEYFGRILRTEYRIADAFVAGRWQVIWGFVYLPARDDGQDIFGRIAEHAPNSLLAEDALLQIADAHLADTDYAEAYEAYDEYLQLFPKSPRAKYAMYQAAQAVYVTFRGIPYDVTPLVEADLRFRTFSRLYGPEARAVGVPELLDHIADLRAQKDYSIAQFYERVDHPDAARFYYNEVILRYGWTDWAPKAKAELKRMTTPAGAEANGGERKQENQADG